MDLSREELTVVLGGLESRKLRALRGRGKEQVE